MNDTFSNVYEDEERARAYATLQFPGTYYLAFRDLPGLIRRYNQGSRALDFGCGTGRSTRFLRNLGLHVIGADISEAMLDHARALDPSGEYHLIRDNITDEISPGSFDIILAAFTFDNMPSEAKANALGALRILLAASGCLLLIVSSPEIYVNEWASFSTRDFSENRHARDGDRVRIIMLDVPDRRPVEDVFCTDAHYRCLFENAGLRVLDVHRPLATGQETTRWISETTTAAWTIYILGCNQPNDDVTQSTGESVTLRTCREAQGPQGLEGTALGISLEGQNELEQSRHEVVVCFSRSHRFAVGNSHGRRF